MLKWNRKINYIVVFPSLASLWSVRIQMRKDGRKGGRKEGSGSETQAGRARHRRRNITTFYVVAVRDLALCDGGQPRLRARSAGRSVGRSSGLIRHFDSFCRVTWDTAETQALFIPSFIRWSPVSLMAVMWAQNDRGSKKHFSNALPWSHSLRILYRASFPTKKWKYVDLLYKSVSSVPRLAVAYTEAQPLVPVCFVCQLVLFEQPNELRNKTKTKQTEHNC